MIYAVVRKEIWYHPDMYFYQDMLFMLERNKKVEEAKQVWADLRSDEVRFDQHTYGDRRVILKGLIPYPYLREKVKEDFLDLFPDMLVYDPPEDLLKEQK